MDMLPEVGRRRPSYQNWPMGASKTRRFRGRVGERIRLPQMFNSGMSAFRPLRLDEIEDFLER